MAVECNLAPQKATISNVSNRRKQCITTTPCRSVRETRPRLIRKCSDNDQVVAERWIFRILNWFLSLSIKFYSFDIQGLEQLDKTKSYLFISHHSQHNFDILLSNIAFYQQTGKIVRGLLHRVVFKCLPPFGWLGHVAGHRTTAVNLLQEGRWVAVIPGGGEEAIEGHENAYQLRWTSSTGRERCGWAKVAQEAKVNVVPVAGVHTQEMAFNIFAFVLNRTGFSRFYNKYLTTLPGCIGWTFYQLQSVSWFIVCSLLSIPVPVKAGLVIGTPMSIGSDETVEDFSNRAKIELQKLMDRENPGGLNYTRALKARFSS